MSKSKSLVVIDDSLTKSVGKLRDYHQIAMNAANQAVAAAIFAGLELRAVQKHLKNCHSGSFENWAKANQDSLGFSARTAFRYLKLAEKVKDKLIEDKQLDRLLSLAPSQMNETQTVTLLKAMHKKVDEKSLNDLYQDYGIVKLPRGAGVAKSYDKDKTPAAQDGSEAQQQTPDLMIQDELFNPLEKMFEYWHAPLKVGKKETPLWQHVDRPKLRQMAERLESMLADIKEALK